MVDRAVDSIHLLVQDRGHELTLDLPAEETWIAADPDRIEQILANLLTNAAKYTEPGGRISLTAACRGQEIELRVRDTGIGMSSELLPRIFDLFMQADSESEHSQRGLGIGLWIVRRLVELHGGRIEAHSAGLGHGSEFVVTLPVCLSGDEALGCKDERLLVQPQLNGLSSRRVLIVEDNDDSARALARLLDSWKLETRVVHDGLAALDMAQSFHPDVVLLDIGLPGMDGYEVARQLKQLPDLNQTRFVALTGFDLEGDPQRSQALGFDQHLVKPVAPEALGKIFEIVS
jgi:CheY-like chemotaxis protein/anti-sigma regulatory factor (Ser/Thr protein kinase)